MTINLEAETLKEKPISFVFGSITILTLAIGFSWSLGYWFYFDVNPLSFGLLAAFSGNGSATAFTSVFVVSSTILLYVFVQGTELSRAYARQLYIDKELLSLTQEISHDRAKHESQIRLIQDCELELNSLLAEEDLGDPEIALRVKVMEDKVSKSKTEVKQVGGELEDLEARLIAVTVESQSNRKYVVMWVRSFITISVLLSAIFVYFGFIGQFLYFGLLTLPLVALLLDYKIASSPNFGSQWQRTLLFLMFVLVGSTVLSAIAGYKKAEQISSPNYSDYAYINDNNEPKIILGVLSEYFVVLDHCSRELKFKSKASINTLRLHTNRKDSC